MQPAERNAPLLEHMNQSPGRDVRRGLWFQHHAKPDARYDQGKREVGGIGNDQLAFRPATSFFAFTLKRPRKCSTARYVSVVHTIMVFEVGGRSRARIAFEIRGGTRQRSAAYRHRCE